MAPVAERGDAVGRVRLMLVPFRGRAMNVATGEVVSVCFRHPTLDIRDMPHFKEALAWRIQQAEGRIASAFYERAKGD